MQPTHSLNKPTTHRKTATALLSAALFGTSIGAQAYSNVVIFGDSLSDGGIYGSRFTTNPGLTSTEYFAQGLGTTTTTSTTGGTNYAQGGARVALASASTPPGAAQRPITTQVAEYFTKTGGVADANTVYVIQGGPNDLLQSQTQASIIAAGTSFGGQIAALSAAGAKLIVMPNVPNLGVTPLSAGNPAGGTAASQGYNAVVQKAVTAYGVDVAVLDEYALISEVVANPVAYGFTNVTGVACTTGSSISCSPATLVTPNAASTYLFADGVHPTTGAQKVIAQYMLATVNAPSQISLLSAAPLAGSQSRMRSLTANMPHAGGMWHSFVDYDHATTKYGETKSTDNGFLAGVDRSIGAGRVGLSFGYQSFKGSFGSGAGGFTLKEPSVGVYYNTALGKDGATGDVTASVSYGHLKADDIKRNITLGTATRTETGSTSGSHWSAAVKAQINAGTLAGGKATHGPVISLGYEDIKLNAFDEAASAYTSTAMSYGAQSRRGFVASLGYQVKGNFGRMSPYARVGYEFDGTRGSGVRSHLSSTYSGFTPTPLETSDGFRAELGTGFAITPTINAHLGLSSTFGKKSGKENSVNIGVDAKF